MEIDYDVSVFIITEFNEYILPEDYDKETDGDGIFVCLTNDRLNPEYEFNNSICIHRDWRNKLSKVMEEFFENIKGVYIYKKYINSIWQKDYKEISNNERYKNCNDTDKDKNLIEYLDGYLGCKNILSNVIPFLKDDAREEPYTIEEYIPAIMITYHTKVFFNGQWYNGYLPAIGQLIFLSSNISKMNSALNAIDEQIEQFKIYNNQLSDNWWSSSQCSAGYAWSSNFGSPLYSAKDHEGQIMPFFAV